METPSGIFVWDGMMSGRTADVMPELEFELVPARNEPSAASAVFTPPKFEIVKGICTPQGEHELMKQAFRGFSGI
jgi:hypothetical protein